MITGGPRLADRFLYDLEGHKRIASLVIDWSDQDTNPVLGFTNSTTPTSFDYPEFSYNSASSVQPIIIGYQVVEIDLATFVGGLGLTECRSISYYARPTFGFNAAGGGPTDFNPGQGNGVGTLILTNTISLQTIGIGGTAVNDQEFAGATEDSCIPFQANGSSMPIRLINTVMQAADSGAPLPLGKVQIQFMNYQLPCYASELNGWGTGI
jgi:hypothetical protein